MSDTAALMQLHPKCGWVSGYHSCERDSCEFPSKRCIEVARERGEVPTATASAAADDTQTNPRNA